MPLNTNNEVGGQQAKWYNMHGSAVFIMQCKEKNAYSATEEQCY